MKRLIFALLIIVQSFNASSDEGIEFMKGSFAEALAKAKKDNKLVFIDCYAVWCGPCKWMDKNVFPKDKIKNFFNENFVNIALDMEKGEGLTVAKEYNVKNYPTYLWLNGDGIVLHRTVGAADEENFLTIAKRAIDPKGNLAYMEDQYGSGNRMPSMMLQYAHMLKDAYDTRYQTIADEYFQSQPADQLASAENWYAINTFTPNINSYTYGAISKSLPMFYDKYGKDSVDNVMDELAINSLSFAKQQKDSAMLKNAVAKLKSSNNKEVKKKGMLGELDFYKGMKNFEKYTALASEYINGYFLDDPKTLNSICWTYFKSVNDKAKLAEAEKWIAKSVELDDKYYNTDTYANLLHKMGKKKEAIAMTNHSIEMAKKEGQNYEDTQNLLNELMKE